MILLVLAYLGGVLTIVSPCILPVLPFVFARADRPFVSSGLPLLAGMAATFAAVATLAAVGDVNELREAFTDFHPEVRHMLASCPEVNKWALVDRDPLPGWSDGDITLLGDACHPMTLYMAQDAAVLSRCLKNVDRTGVADAFRRFEATRKPRTSRMQLSSRTNTWPRDKTDPDWVYGYDAWTAPLAEHG